jgi:DUF438 domain-containing protein
MSELINNREVLSGRETERQAILKDIFLDLYHGKSKEEVQACFDEKIGEITLEELSGLSALQGEYIASQGLSESEIKRLSALHMSIIEGKIKRAQHPQDEPGHPVHTFLLENREIEKLIQTRLQPHLRKFEEDDGEESRYKLIEDYNLLLDVDKHYTRKEQLLFPYLEKYGINGPSINMWRLDDFIRDAIKAAKRNLTHYDGDKTALLREMNDLVEQTRGMVYREEQILFPMAMEHLTEDEWIKIAGESEVIGFCLIDGAEKWIPHRDRLDGQSIADGYIKMETGTLSLRQLELIMNHLPVDLTFIDHNDIVRYFSHGKERIFARTKAVIGRTVQNCHPPKSAHVVEALLDDFKSGKKDSEDFWIPFRDKFVYIRYFAVRDDTGAYMGTLEFTQNIGPIQAIQGEKRIMS